MGVVAISNRARYYVSSFGAAQAAKLYAARGLRLPSIAIRVPNIEQAVICRPCEADRFTICHVFVERDCEVPLELSPHLIVDAGANVGYASVYYANRYPGATVIAIEPDAGNLAVASRNCEPYSGIRILQAGLWSHDGPLRIVDPGFGSWGFRMRQATEDDKEVVEGLSIPTLLRRFGYARIDILKLDIEGGEEEVFSSQCNEWLPLVDVILVETHGEAAEEAVNAAMNEASFVQIGSGHRSIFVNPSCSGCAPCLAASGSLE